ncbi:MAG: hypothetical protein A2Y12_06225 [Planctomycetes bacterium GWF2_42_9]|nr:MAG: hypothetical protein A2Y12_06225 [Planctomycetes bacterium GWF2_42_9]
MKRNVLVGLCLLFCTVCLAEAYTQLYGEVTVFDGDEDYDCYRIPSIVRTNNGTLLAVAEGRVDGCGDKGNIDIVVKRSTNNGASWGSTILIDSFGSARLHNPCPVVNKNTGRVYVFYCVDANTIAYKYNDNNGANGYWSDYIEIPSYPSDVDTTNGSIHTGPCNGIQLQRGSHIGRLVIPYRYKTAAGRKIDYFIVIMAVYGIIRKADLLVPVIMVLMKYQLQKRLAVISILISGMPTVMRTQMSHLDTG